MKNASMFLLFLAMTLVGTAQDKIYLRNGETVTSFNTIIPFRGDMITCHKTADKGAAEFTLQRADIFTMDRVKPGKYVFFFNNKNMLAAIAKKDLTKLGVTDYTRSNPCLDGILGCANNYRATGTMIGTFIPSFLAWPVGLVGTIIVSAKRPAEGSIGLDQAEALADQTYADCYREYAFKTKKRFAWLGWANGTTLGIAIGSLIITLASM